MERAVNTERERERAVAGRLLREIRLRAGMTQAELAARLGISQSTVCRAERGKIVPSREHRAWAAAQWIGAPSGPHQTE